MYIAISSACKTCKTLFLVASYQCFVYSKSYTNGSEKKITQHKDSKYTKQKSVGVP